MPIFFVSWVRYMFTGLQKDGLSQNFMNLTQGQQTKKLAQWYFHILNVKFGKT